jgi:hypothetical protein
MERVEERLTAVQASLNANNSRIVARERRGMQSKLDQEVASMREATEGAIRNGAALEAPPRDPAAVNLQLREIALESQVRVLSGSALEQAESELRSVRSRIETIEEARRGALALSEASIRQRAHQKVFDFRAEREAEMERKLDLRLEALRRADAERIRGYREALRGAVIAKPKAELAAPGEESIRAPAHGRPILPSLSGRQRPPSVTVGMAPSLRPEAVNELRNAVRFEVKQDATNAARRLGLDVRFEPEPGRRDYTREMISLLYGAGRQE